MNNYTIREDANYGNVLQINGKDAICPFQAATPIPVQNQFGNVSMGFNRMPCSTVCPFAKISDVDTGMYVISCCQEKQLFELEEPEKKESILIGE